MKLSLILLLSSMLSVFAFTAQAQEKTPSSSCQQQIKSVADTLPDLSENPNAAADMGIDKEQLQAALAALDAARIVNYDSNNCQVMVNAARSVLQKGS